MYIYIYMYSIYINVDVFTYIDMHIDIRSNVHTDT